MSVTPVFVIPLSLSLSLSLSLLQDTSEELERLRREVRKYRMELSNREGNFNRMFTDSVPVRVDQRVAGNAFNRTKSDASMRPQMVSQI